MTGSKISFLKGFVWTLDEHINIAAVHMGLQFRVKMRSGYGVMSQLLEDSEAKHIKHNE